MADPHRKYRTFLSHLTTAMLKCRAAGHWWDAYTATFDNDARAWHVEEVCARCEAHRVRWLTREGYLAGHASIRYPEGYLYKGNSIGAGERRAAARRRLLSDMTTPRKD